VQSDGQCTGKKPSWLPDRMSGWTCTDGAIPAAEDFKANESRADFFYFLCATPVRGAQPAGQLLLLLRPRADPARRLVHQRPERAELRVEPFGFSCYGRDRRRRPST
jgi:hypothetical protein